ncbi:tyrosine-type recombinase/integrase [Agrobacterium salinitolerans]|uniref:Tyr recombinase domain-containing protein n=1 Tax=Agrobacterium salinitolerans TaxID=1183413 RepID=A0ABY3BUN8_9HYPH|nr:MULTISPECIES: tyrosine-type recombinase/integrase [Agrobacterium]MCZ7890468.1 tyrosine-type recombinase/integrase [Agrobacterium salinitolerans]TRA96810.1 hypothetical protein EXN23_00815 [Agrobacterium salinitolerans]
MSNEFFDGNTIRKINNLYSRGKPTPAVWRDTVCQGLTITIGVKKASWHMRLRDCNARIADFEDFGSADKIPTLREAVDFARTIVASGGKPDEFFKMFAERKDLSIAMAWHGRVDPSIMTWEIARDQYLDWCFRNRRHATWEGYKSALGASNNSALTDDFAPIAGKALVAIVEGDLDTVRNNIVTRCKRRVEAKIEAAKKAKKEIVIGNEYGHRAANLTVAALRSAFKHFKMWPEIYGLKNNVAAALANTQDRPPNSTLESNSGEAEAAMTQYDLGAYMYGVERVKNPIVRSALWLQLRTGQRRFTATAAIRSSFRENPHYGLVWRLRDKVGHWRLLPLTEETAALVYETLDRYKDRQNAYLFPISKRMDEDGKPVQGHLNKRTFSAAIEDMRDEGGVFFGHPNPPSSHDVRYAFITRMGNEMHRFTIDGRRLSFRDIEIITHANEGKEGTASLIYDRSQALDVKEILLKEWQDYLMEGYRMYCEGLTDPVKRAEFQAKGVADAQRVTARPVLVVDNVEVETGKRRTSQLCFSCDEPDPSLSAKQRICTSCIQGSYKVG